jgi:MoxR-like ATPase
MIWLLAQADRKTALAESLAEACNLPVYYLQGMEGLTLADVLYDWDREGQTQWIRQAVATGRSFEEARAGQWTREFLVLGEALAAYERAAQGDVIPILICGEFDKVSEELEDTLLQLFARGYAHVEIGVRDQSQWPVVILLSNDQRHDLSAPMRSRCLFSWLPPPTPREEVRILSARCPQASCRMLIKTAKMINAIRGLPGIIDKPGLRESIALLRALVAEGCADLTVNEIEDHLCFLAKRRLDLENLRKSLARVEVVMELRDGEIESWVDELERRAAARTQPRAAGTRTTQPLAAYRGPSAEGIRDSSMTGLVHQLRRSWQRKPQSLTHLCEQLDARYGIPRPAAAPHLPPYQAAILFLSVCAEGMLIIASGILSAWLWVKSASWLSISIEVELFCHVMALTGLFIAFAEAAQLPLPYYHLHQRSTYGTSRWADPILLKDLGLARRKGEPLKAGELSLGGMGTKYDVVLNAAQTMCHLAMFGVLIGLGVRCAAFNIPNAKAISSPISPASASSGIRAVNFAELRRPRTAIYVVVPEGDAMRYKVVVATLFGLAASHLRKEELTPDPAPALFNFDEAGNIFIHGLSELLGVGRGRRICVALGYQNIGQVYHHYGSDGGDAVLGSVGTMIFLPGLDHRTAEYASKRIGQATVWQSTSIDVKHGNRFDSERSTEVGRALMDASEVRRMVKHRQAVAIIGNAPPVRLSYPPMAKLKDALLSPRERACKENKPSPPRRQPAPVNGKVEDQASAQTEVVVGAINRPTFSFGQITSLSQTAFPPEYDPNRIDPSRDPCIDDGPEHHGMER